MSSDTPFLQQRLLEAARYALMRRLLPAIRHDIADKLQPIGMMAAIIQRQTHSAALDLAQLGKNGQALAGLSSEAVANALNLMTWLGPRDNELVAVNSAVEESLKLMATELSFRGFSIVNETANLPTRLPREILQSVFMASLIALTDFFEGAAKVVVSAADTDTDTGTQLKIALEPGECPELIGLGGRTLVYRRLGWDDVEVLADSQGVGLSRGANWVQLLYRFPAGTA
jgi:hypothetical protein